MPQVLGHVELESENGDLFFEKQRETEDNATDQSQSSFLILMQRIQLPARWMQPRGCLLLGTFSNDSRDPASPTASLCGITLPKFQGGFKIPIDNWRNDLRIRVSSRDITLLAGEMGINLSTIQASQPDASKFCDVTGSARRFISLSATCDRGAWLP
ncbi:hypothetical protein B0T22DRAFT_537532 [Podospora appendiculata]|uniref:Uncharacterized protein n=1 Tax=Podospora appendiculata TaxID=314037 RepID=A0AAE0X565_9PEZI|nr:hypothetical protein B0T22DRAFT_537532 [Podospora appendiculata]